MRKSHKYSKEASRGGGNKGGVDKMFVPGRCTSRSAPPEYIRDEFLPVVKTTGILVCVNYSDYLEHCLPVNTKELDEIIVVTSSADTTTQDLCSQYDNVQTIITDCFYDDGAVFNKGRALNKALATIDVNKANWILITDADTILPIGFADNVKGRQFNSKTLYGAVRYFAYTLDTYHEFVSSSSDYELLDGVYSPGKSPIGYFQFFNAVNLKRRNMTVLTPYPDTHDDASWSDLVFTKKFEQKDLLRGVKTIHIGPTGVNHRGRITPIFKPVPVVEKELNFKYPGHCNDAGYKKIVNELFSYPRRSGVDQSVSDYVKEHNVYISLTTSPLRLSKVYYPLNTLDLEFITSIFLALPEKYRDEELYKIPRSLLLDTRVTRINSKYDLGPINKLLPALRYLKREDPNSILITIDDDTTYPFGMITEMILELSISKKKVVTASAPDLSFWDINPKTWPSKDTKVSEGFAGIAYKVSDISYEAMFEMKELSQSCRSCKFSDDIVHSYVLAKHGLDVTVLNNSYYSLNHIQQLEYGFGSDAIFKASGLPEFKGILDSDDVRPDGVNMHKYKDCLEHLKNETFKNESAKKNESAN